MYAGEQDEIYSNDIEYIYQNGSGVYTDLFSSVAKKKFQSAAETSSKKLGEVIGTKVVDTIDKKLINKPTINKPPKIKEEPIAYEVEMIPLREINRGKEIKRFLEEKSEEEPNKNTHVKDRVRALF